MFDGGKWGAFKSYFHAVEWNEMHNFGFGLHFIYITLWIATQNAIAAELLQAAASYELVEAFPYPE